MEQKIRKYQNILSISGIATIVFGVWGIIKSILFVVMNPYSADGAGLNNDAAYALFVSVLIIYVIIALLLRLYVGLSARGESKGKKKGILYLICTGFLMLVSLAWIISAFLQIKEAGFVDVFVSVIIDLISLFALTETMIYGIKLKQLKG